MTTPALKRVRGRAAHLRHSEAILEKAIREAHADGQSLRAIAEAAGLSHEQVRRIVRAES